MSSPRLPAGGANLRCGVVTSREASVRLREVVVHARNAVAHARVASVTLLDVEERRRESMSGATISPSVGLA
jgi:hypothetical protein